jgi:hypothetical protein
MRGGAEGEFWGVGGVEETIQIGNERFRPPNNHEKGDGERIVGYRVCVEMEKDTQIWETGTIISFQRVMRGSSSHTIKFDSNDGPTTGVKLMRKTGTDPDKKNWKILSLQYTPEQLGKTTINDPGAGIWNLDPATPGSSPMSSVARGAALEAWGRGRAEREPQEAIEQAQKAIERAQRLAARSGGSHQSR